MLISNQVNFPVTRAASAAKQRRPVHLDFVGFLALNGMCDQELDLVLPSIRHVTLSPMQNWTGFYAGEVDLFYIADGLVRRKIYCQRNFTCIGFAKEGDCRILQGPTPYKVQAIEQTQIEYLPAGVIGKLAVQNPSFKKLCMQLAEKDIIDLGQIAEMYSMKHPRQKYNFFRKKYPTLVDRLPADLIAAFLRINEIEIR